MNFLGEPDVVHNIKELQRRKNGIYCERISLKHAWMLEEMEKRLADGETEA